MLEFYQVTKSFQEKCAVSSMSFSICEGDSIALSGPSGCGKTTLLRLVLGLECPDTGYISLGRKVISSPTVLLSPAERKMAAVFQEPRLWSHWNVKQNLDFVSPQLPLKEKNSFLQNVIQWTGIGSFLHQKPHELSGGQARRVALARALFAKRKWLLLDEPFAHLDNASKAELLLAVQLARECFEFSLILVTHDLQDATALKARCISLASGA